MPKFDLKKILTVRGKQDFYQLTVDDNPNYLGKKTEDEKNEAKHGVLDEYENGLETKYKPHFNGIVSYMQLIANNEHVSGKKYHELSGRDKSDTVKDFEFKNGDLRVYCFKSPLGKIIAVGGYKNEQGSDIVKMRNLKKQYLESLR